MDTHDVAVYTKAHGGGTFTSFDGCVTQWSGEDEERAWVVAYKPSYPHKNTEYKLYGDDSRFIREAVWEFLKANHNNGSLFGTWIDYAEDPYILYIDHVFVTTKGMALNFAEMNGEKAIYNLVTKEEVRL